MSTILEILPAGKYKLVAGTSGGEWAGPCPWCGGTDRFLVWPEHPSGATGGRYWCRGCPRRGDGIQFLRDHEGLSYQDACRALQVAPRPPHSRQAINRPVAWTPRPTVPPAEIWQHKASLFVAGCSINMTPGSPGMVYAEGRGLTANTVMQLRIGWNPTDNFEDRSAWGLASEVNAKGNQKKVWLPAGLVIPSHRNAGIAAVKVRRSEWAPEDTRPKYIAVAGSVPGLALGCGTDKPVVLVESELDAALVWQEAGTLVGVIALATATGKPDADTTTYLRTVPRILVALDFDRAGIDAFPWWPRHFAQAEPWPVVQGKDVGDLAVAPGLVRAWIEAALLPTYAPKKIIEYPDDPIASAPCPEAAPDTIHVERVAPVGRDACIKAVEAVFGPVIIEDSVCAPTLNCPDEMPQRAAQMAMEGSADVFMNEIEGREAETVSVATDGHVLCKGCGRLFQPSRLARVYCSARCSNTVSLPLAEQPRRRRISWTPIGPSSSSAR